MDQGCVRIKRLVNGFGLYYMDPEIIKSNRSGKMSAPYRDPEKEMAFKDVKSLTAFLNTNLEKLASKDDYETSFDKAVMEMEDGD